MDDKAYGAMEQYMKSCMSSPNDRLHVYRVLHAALDIAQTEREADLEILTAACLLHDIGRDRQKADPSVVHAPAGADMAFDYLLARGWTEERAERVKSCIRTHSMGQGDAPATIEAKILFDADKLDVLGATGTARMLMHFGGEDVPMYSPDSGGAILDGSGDEAPSFFRDYRQKLRKLGPDFFTERGREMAADRQKTAAAFCDGLLAELNNLHDKGRSLLRQRLTS